MRDVADLLTLDRDVTSPAFTT